MLFQTLDDKNDCVAIYKNGTISSDPVDEELTHTWAPSTYLAGFPIEYAYLYCQQTLEEVCPEHLSSELKEVLRLFRAYMLSMVEAKVDINRHCFYDMVPNSFLVRFCEVKNQIAEHVFENYKRPKNYTFLKELSELTQEMHYRRLKLDFSRLPLSKFSTVTRKQFKSIRSAAPYVRYNIFGTKTGRLATKSGSFPILSTNKEFRQAILPSNDKFVEFDFNAFELRVLFYLLDREQPSIDLHEWNVKNVYGDSLTREEAKTRIFAWLFNLDSKDRLSEDAYSRGEILERYWNGSSISNPFGRVTESDKFHAVPYLVQSTAVDIVLRQMIKLDKLLKNKKSHIAFTIHDSVVIDMAEEDMSLLPELKRQFSTFRDTQFLTNVSIGSDFGNMESEKGVQHDE